MVGTLIIVGGTGQSSASFGGVVFLGPFPVAFGEGPGSGLLVLTAVVIGLLMVVSLLASVLLSRRRSRDESGYATAYTAEPLLIRVRAATRHAR